jgi:hypothetical protein
MLILPRKVQSTPMSQDPRAAPLEYYRPKLVKAPPTPESIRWRWYRIWYRVGLAVLFVSVAFYFGPNEIRFDKLTRLTPADLVPIVQRDCMATVRAMQQYQQDTGSLPNSVDDLIPQYLPAALADYRIANGQFSHFDWRWHETITYDFTPGSEGWHVTGHFVTGRIPLPTVKPGP